MTAGLIEPAPGFDEIGISAFTTTRLAGDFSLGSREPVGDVIPRWFGLSAHAGLPVNRIANTHQVHGTDILVHGGDWSGFLRAGDADGHFASGRPTLMAVTLADCVPIFLGHSSGAAAVLHSGWKGTAAHISQRGVEQFTAAGIPARELIAHCGPSICGRCYEVGPDVYARVTGHETDRPTAVDLRAMIAAQLQAAGLRRVTISESCTRCNNDRFFSHRCGDVGRQLGVIVSR